MTQTQKPFIALLRGINVGGHNKIPMADLRELCSGLGWHGVKTYIQSGNIVFSADSSCSALENELEQAIEQRFGFSISVIVRDAKQWSEYMAGNPFPNASVKEPNLVMLGLSKATPKAEAAQALSERAVAGERVVRVGAALWTHFPGGSARSKLSPALLDRLVGSPVTTRNWRTVMKLKEMLSQI